MSAENKLYLTPLSPTLEISETVINNEKQLVKKICAFRTIISSTKRDYINK